MTDSKTFCEFDYMESKLPTTRTVLSTLCILVLSILLEVAVNARLDGCGSPGDARHTSAGTESAPSAPVHSQPQLEPQPQASAQPQPGAAQTPDAKEDRTNAFCCPTRALPLVRANRLVAAILLFIPLVAVFSLRMGDVVTPYIRPGCREYFGSDNMPAANMWVVVLLNIVPFICGCFAVLRALVDVVLVRWDTRLTYDVCTKTPREYGWFPCLPLFAVSMVGCLALMCVRWPVALLMGRPGSSIWEEEGERDQDIEMQGEQGRGLLEDVEGDGDVSEREGSAVGLPSYDEVVRPHDKVYIE
jgi:hypothetical protein